MDMASGEQMIMFGVRRGDSSLVGMVEHQSTGEKLGGLILGTTLRRFEPRTIHLADVDRIQERRQDVPASIAAGATVIGVGVGLGVMMVRFLGSLLPPSSGPLTSHWGRGRPLLDAPLIPPREIRITSSPELVMRYGATVLLLCILSAPAWGQSGESGRHQPATGGPDSFPGGGQSNPFVSADQQALAPRGRSPQSALRIGLAATLIPVTAGLLTWDANRDPSTAALVITGGVILGPAVGYWSAGMSGRGWKSLGLRAALALGSFASGMAICGWSCSVGDANYDLAWTGVATGSGLGAFSAWYDLARMKSNVRQHNDRRATQRIAIMPTFDPRTRTLGLHAGLVFWVCRRSSRAVLAEQSCGWRQDGLLLVTSPSGFNLTPGGSVLLRTRRLTTGLLAGLQLLAGCHSWQVVAVSPRALVDSAHAKAIRIEEKRGAKYIIGAPAVVGDSLMGTVLRIFPAKRLVGRPRSVETKPRVIPLASIDRVAVRKPSGWRTAMLALGVPAAVAALLVAAMSNYGTIGFQ
jgi:hypothetical protein